MKSLLLLTAIIFTFHLNAANFNKKEVENLTSVIKHNVKAMNDEDINAYMQDVHPNSPGYAATKNMLTQLFKIYDLKVTLISIKPLMIDDQYFIVRAQQKTIKKSGTAPFSDNIIDVIHVYKKYQNKWLLWSSMILEVKKLNKK